MSELVVGWPISIDAMGPIIVVPPLIAPMTLPVLTSPYIARRVTLNTVRMFTLTQS